jgi:hypothetical protein
MKRIFAIIIFILVAAVSLLFYSCGDIEEENGNGVVGTLISITINPSAVTLEVGATQSFSSEAIYSTGTVKAAEPSWLVSGSIGTIVRAGYVGIFTASSEGTGTIIASYGGKSAHAAVTVTGPAGPGGVVTIEVIPAGGEIKVGDTLGFAFVGYDASGEAIEVNPSWLISGDAVGVFTPGEQSAILTAEAEGSATICCVSGEVVGYSYVTVEGFTVEITVEIDTYVDESNPSATHESDTSLKAGYVSATDRDFEAYFKFLLTSIPSTASIESAALKIYCTSAGGSSLQLKDLTSAFTANTSWEARPSVGSYLAARSFTSGQYNEIGSAALKDLVQDWLDGTTDNYGLTILQEGSDNGVDVFLSLENGDNPPMLRIEYTD